MEILYIHVKEYRNFLHQDFNFGGKYRFEYNYIAQELIVYENHQYIEDFYSLSEQNSSGAQFSNVSGIIGENGTGKSSILKFILRNFVYGNAGIEDEQILCIRNNEDYILYYTNDVPIRKHNLNQFGISIQQLKINDHLIGLFDVDEEIEKKDLDSKIELFEKLDFLFFSNSFNNENHVELKGSRDISTDFLIRSDYNFKAEMSIIDPALDKRQLDHFKFEEIKRQVAFITAMKSHENLIPFSLPDELIMEVSNDMLFNQFELDQRLQTNLQRHDQLSSFIKMKSILCGFDNSNSINRIIGNGYMNLMIDMLIIPSSLFPIKALIRTIVTRIKATQNILQSIDKTIVYIKSYNQLQLPKGFIERLETLANLHSFLTKIQPKERLDSVFGRYARRVSIPVSEIKKFYAIYNKTYHLRPYVDFDWRSLSSGEKAIFSLYARFFSLSNSQSIGNELKENIIILLDEPDLYLHPQWQKVLLHNLIDFLKHIYAKTTFDKSREIQIMFTTNSPLMISDLLVSNAVFLKKENQNVIVNDSISDQKQTFAANIHTLFADSFFIQNGLIGEIASLKINAIIKQLNRMEPLDHLQHEKMRKTILQIGEPLIKTKLIQMYNDRFSMNIHERIDNIEKRLDK